ncbi:MAG: prolyl oligopeptidase family serine peptidase, partial [Lentisphaerae bacterium]|nr:prolyl oligopeptidase family serine peptidase [Lentisphaerota bacterium]
ASSCFNERAPAAKTLDGKLSGQHFWAGRPGQAPWTLTFDLGVRRELSGLEIAFYDRNGRFSHTPEETRVETSENGADWTSTGAVPAPGPWTAKSYRLVLHEFKGAYRFIRLTMGKAPTGKQPAVWGVQFYLADGTLLGGGETFTEMNVTGTAAKAKVETAFPGLETVAIVSTADDTEQPARFFKPAGTEEPAPLLVLLHTWSGDYRQNSFVGTALAECRKRGWGLVFPHFRGPNWHPDACGSELAGQDIVDAVAYAHTRFSVDASRVYLFGQSGGGHMSLVMATRAPQLWAGVSAWVPITDLAAWHRECTAAKRGYAKHMEKACGGKPGDSPEIDAQYRARSSLPFLEKAKGLRIDVQAGIHDGHTGSVPVSHSLRAFNGLAEANGLPEKALSVAQIQTFTAAQVVPDELQGECIAEPGRLHPILFRREAGPARVTIFKGGHSGDIKTAIRWFAEIDGTLRPD